MKAWGPKPSDLGDAFGVVRQQVADAPKLIPIYSHRYIPCEPSKEGNPIFSVYQTDIIHYGYDLTSYLVAEFAIPKPSWVATTPRPIKFWSNLIDGRSFPL